MTKYEPRPYQQEAIDIILDLFSKPKIGPSLVVHPTGSGKGLIIGNVAAHMASVLKEPILVLQPSKELLEQNYSKLQSYGGKATIYSASMGVKEISLTTFATLGSIRKIADQFKALGVKKIMLDEAHFKFPPDPGSMFMKFIKVLNPTHIIGLTATPFRLKAYGDMGGTWSQLNIMTRERPRIFKKIVHIVQIPDIVKQKYWAKLNYELWDFDDSTLKLNSSGAEYTEKSISSALASQNVNNNIFRRIQELHREGKSGLVFLDSVANCEIMAKKLSYVKAITGKTKKLERDKIIKDFKKGEVKFIVNYGTLIVGFDYPELDTVLLGRPSNSLAVIYQIFGRVVRNPEYPNQKEALIIDFCNNVKRFGKLEDLELLDIPEYGWAMVSKDRVLTGVPMNTTVLLSDVIKASQIKLDSKENYIMEFGKHKGKKLSEVPTSYQDWMMGELDGLKVTSITKSQLKLQLLALRDKVPTLPPPDKDVSILVDLNNVSFSLFNRRQLHKEGFEVYLESLRRQMQNGVVEVISEGKKSEYWRGKIYPKYKTNRTLKPQKAGFSEGLSEIYDNFDILTEKGMEADDIIARKVREFKGKAIYVVSSDSDFKQLNMFSRFRQFNPLTHKLLKIPKKEAVRVLVTKILKGDQKDNVKKCHLHGRILTADLDKCIDKCFDELVNIVKSGKVTDIQNIDLEGLIYKNLSDHFDLDKNKYKLNFKLLNLMQKVNY